MPRKKAPLNAEVNGIAPDGTVYKTTPEERERERQYRADLRRRQSEKRNVKPHPVRTSPSFTPDFKPSHASAMTREEYMRHFYDKPKAKIGLNASLGQQSLLR